MHILFVSFDEVPSFKGATTHILGGLRVVRRSHRVSLITLGETALRPSTGIFHYPVNVKLRNTLRRGLVFRDRVAHLLRRLKPDVIHFRSPWEGLPAVRSGTPSIYEVNGLPSIELPYYYPSMTEHTAAVFREWEQECLERSAAVLCPAPRIAEHLQSSYRGVAIGGVTVFRNAYDPVPAQFLKTRSARRNRDVLRLVYLGTISPWQGVQWSLRAIAQLQGRCRLDIFAQPQKLPTRRLLRRIRRLGLEGAVTLHDPIDRRRMLSLLPSYDFMFAPLLKTARNAEQGCCPLKLLDALSHGLPVLASDLNVVRSLVSHGEGAYLFEPGRTVSLVEALERLHADEGLCARLRSSVPNALAAHWTWESYGEALSRLYEDLRA